MRTPFLLAGAAALALSASALANENGRGGGRGNDRGGGAERSERGNGRQAQGVERRQARADRPARVERQARPERHARAERGPVVREARREVRQERREDRREVRRDVREDRREVRRDVREARRDVREDRREVRQDRRQDVREVRQALGDDRDRRLVDRIDGRRDFFRRLNADRGFCPPGLARQNRWCMPPGQLRRAQRIGQRLPFADLAYNVPDRYRYRFADDGRYFYRYGDDQAVYRFDRNTNLVSGIFPLVSTGLIPGEPLPLGYDVYNVPLSYRDYYPDNGEDYYRYEDDAIYRVDRQSGIVESIVALLGGGGLGNLGIGDMMPSGYDAYNVPMDYRDEYADSDDALYRYADNSIYQVDPQTQMIEAVISLLT
jgi:hypothetical protein